MTRTLALCLLVGLSLACTPKRVVQASATIEDLPNEVGDGGAAASVPAPVPAALPEQVVDASPMKRVEVPEGFSVLFPIEPQAQRNSMALKTGTLTTVSLTANVNGVVYAVTRADYPEAIVVKAGPKKMLAEARNSLTKQVKEGKLSDEKDQDLAGQPGQTFSVSGQDRLVKARSGLVQNQLYTLVVVYTGPTPDRAEAFLNSLELKAPAPAPTPAPKYSLPAAAWVRGRAGARTGRPGSSRPASRCRPAG